MSAEPGEFERQLIDAMTKPIPRGSVLSLPFLLRRPRPFDWALADLDLAHGWDSR